MKMTVFCFLQFFATSEIPACIEIVREDLKQDFPGCWIGEYVTNLDTSVSTATTTLLHKSSNVKVKGKAIPVQAWTGPYSCRRLRLPDFQTIGT
jgi:hypothetical protein